MSYSILRVQKHKGNTSKVMQKHLQREAKEHANQDIDQERSHLNYDLHNRQPIDLEEEIDRRIQERYTAPRAIRTDAVKHVEFLATSDQEFFQNLSKDDQDRFFEESYSFIKDFAGEKNVLYANVHLDERTPHMHAGFVPLDETGRLKYKSFINGKGDMTKLQDRYHKHMNKKGFDLERGVKRNVKHLPVAEFKAQTIKELDHDIQRKSEERKLIHEDLLKSFKKGEISDYSNEPVPTQVPFKQMDYSVFDTKKGLMGGSIKISQEEWQRVVEEDEIKTDRLNHSLEQIHELKGELAEAKRVAKGLSTKLDHTEELLEKVQGQNAIPTREIKQRLAKHENLGFEKGKKSFQEEHFVSKEKYDDLLNKYNSLKEKALKMQDKGKEIVAAAKDYKGQLDQAKGFVRDKIGKRFPKLASGFFNAIGDKKEAQKYRSNGLERE